MTYHTYILYSAQRDRYYIGATGDDLQERLRRHNSHHKGFTGNTNDWAFYHVEAFASLRGNASCKEYCVLRCNSAIISRNVPTRQCARARCAAVGEVAEKEEYCVLRSNSAITYHATSPLGNVQGFDTLQRETLLRRKISNQELCYPHPPSHRNDFCSSTVKSGFNNLAPLRRI